MSVQQENEKKSCPSRGLGIAAVAIGVGVGAALYYYFSKRQAPDNEGATTSGWTCEPHTLSDTSYSTISEYSTTDTSMNTTSFFEPDEISQNESFSSSSSYETFNSESSNSESAQSDSESAQSDSESAQSDTESEWDVSSDDSGENRQSFSIRFINAVASVRHYKTKHQDRTWAPEECAICFDMMTTQQNVLSLPCTHRFHKDCILTWLEQRQTCPVCRKVA